jgi:hypothetical protein
VIVETKNGDIYNPETLQKVDRITKAVVGLKGVVPYQILSIAHPKVKSITAREGALQIREIFYPAVPKTQEDADRVKFAVYSTKGVRGIFTALDDTAAVVHAGSGKRRSTSATSTRASPSSRRRKTTRTTPSTSPACPGCTRRCSSTPSSFLYIFVLTFLTLAFLLYTYFRTWTGIWVPGASPGVLSSVWGLGFAAVLGFNFDPLVLVIPIFLTAPRAQPLRAVDGPLPRGVLSPA